MNEQARGAAAEIAHELDVLLKQGLRLYQEGHPVVRKYWERLSDRMAEHLGRVGPMTYRLKPQCLIYEGQEVYRDEEIVPENFVLRLYRDGIREVGFVPGLRPEELYQFVQVLATNPLLLAFMGETLASRLFDANLKAVRFVMVPPVLLTEEAGRLAHADIHGLAEASAGDREGLNEAIERLPGLSSQELSELKSELDGEGDEEVGRLLGILMELLVTHEGDDERRQIRAAISSLFESLVAQGASATVVEGLTRLSETAPDAEVLAREWDAIVEKLSLSPVLSMMAESAGPKPRGFVRLLALLQPPCLPAALRLLFRIEDPDLTQSLIRTVARLAGESLEEIQVFMDDSRTANHVEALRHGVNVLWEMDTPDGRRAVMDIVLDADHPVRADALSLLLRRYDPDLEPVLGALIDDEDPEVRSRAVEGFLRADLAAAKLRITMSIERSLEGDALNDVGRDLAAIYLRVDRTGGMVYLLSRLEDPNRPVALRRVAAELLTRHRSNKRVEKALKKERDRWLNPRALRKTCEEALR